MNGNNKNGPCGACKLLRRKCVKGCVFAPYFDQEQGTTQFAAVHKVFGASNASKLLLRIPPQKRVDAVVTLSYEAFARARDPVYGCVAHIFTLQQQVMNLQAELAYTQARLTTLQRLPAPPSPLLQWPQTPSPPPFHSTSEFQSCTSTNAPTMSHFDQPTNFQSSTTHHQMPSIFQSTNQDLEDDDLEALARELAARYLPTAKTRPPPSASSQ